MPSNLKGSFEVNRHAIDTGHSDVLGAEPASVAAGGPLGAPRDPAGGDLKADVAVVIILTGVGASVGADGVHILGAPVDEGVGGLAGILGHLSALHHEVAIAAGVQLGVGLRVVDVLPLELLVTGFPLGGGWPGSQQDHQEKQH